ncbi:MAG: decaprenyl-phosphate phosphoribosyltransferase [Acidimicrobiales bacterium]
MRTAVVRRRRSESEAAPGAQPATSHGAPAPVGPALARPLGRRTPARAWLSALRPRQWVKNVLVLTAPVAAGVIGKPSPLVHAVLAMLCFCAASSGIYLVNDSLDVVEDRLHPSKRRRPIAAGEISAVTAKVAGIVLAVASLAAGVAVGGWSLGVVLAIYVAISFSYSFGLKRVPVIELLCVSSGFLLRATAGGVAARVHLSLWFLVFISSGALLIGTGKRTAEYLELGEERASHRPVLAFYRLSWLVAVRYLTAAITIGTYFLWSLVRAGAVDDRVHDGLFFELSVIPFIVIIVLIERAIDKGRGGAPEELAFHDRYIQLAGVALVALLAVGLYS